MEAYAYSTAAWLSLQALPLFLSPKLMVTMLSPEARVPTGATPSFLSHSPLHSIPKNQPTNHPPPVSDLETYLSRTLSLTLLALSALTILLSGLLPLSSMTAEAEQHSPYKFPTTLITATFHGASAVYMYTNYMASGSICLVLGLMGSGFLTCFGVWCLMFGGGDVGKGRVSGWPFRNEEERREKREKRGGKRGL